MIYPELDINGMTTENDVIEMIKDTIDDGSPSDLDSAKDYIDQFKEYLLQPKITVEPSKSEREEGKKPFMADALDHHQIMKKGVVR